MPIFQDNRDLLRRLTWIRFALVLVFVSLFVKLWVLTVVDYEHYKNLAERNRVRTLPELAPRGLIYDRDGRVLVDNVHGFNLLLFRDEVEVLENTLQFLVEGLEIGEETILERLKLADTYDLYQPVVIKENLSLEETAYILSHQSEHPELRILKQPRRIYRYGKLAAHMLGYVGEISQRQLKQQEFAQHKPGDIVGQYGVERTYDEILTGRDGWSRVLVDSRGKVLEELDRVDAVLGGELTLTLDLDLQAAAEAQLGQNPGAVVAFDAQTGEILVMASRPTFDPNQFAVRISRKEWLELLEDPDDPLQNRCIQSTFSPGSIFKIVMALAGLEHELVNPEKVVYCSGGVELYGHWFRCWKAGGHGKVTLRKAIRQSCNVYFYLLGQKLGIQEIAAYSRQLGLGLPTGIELSGEATGLIPSEDWKRRVRGEPWYPGETISVAIGQGPVLVTPLQLAKAMGVIATGRAPELDLVKGTDNAAMESSSLEPAPFSPQHLNAIREAMWSVVNEGGTGGSARVADFEVCGKTGTAQTISRATQERLSEETAEKFEPHAWFVGFAPKENPRIVVAVIVQRGGSGGATAAPIAGQILKLYYEKYQPSSPRSLEVASKSDSSQGL